MSLSQWSAEAALPRLRSRLLDLRCAALALNFQAEDLDLLDFIARSWASLPEVISVRCGIDVGSIFLVTIRGTTPPSINPTIDSLTAFHCSELPGYFFDGLRDDWCGRSWPHIQRTLKNRRRDGLLTVPSLMGHALSLLNETTVPGILSLTYDPSSDLPIIVTRRQGDLNLGGEEAELVDMLVRWVYPPEPSGSYSSDLPSPWLPQPTPVLSKPKRTSGTLPARRTGKQLLTVIPTNEPSTLISGSTVKRGVVLAPSGKSRAERIVAAQRSQMVHQVQMKQPKPRRSVKPKPFFS